MSNLGKAVYMAAFAFLFIVAATTAIYLYGTLNAYLNSTTSIIDMADRAEGILVDDTSTTRDIQRSEIYITLFNMRQMNVSSVTVNGNKVSQSDVEEYNVSPLSGGKMSAIMHDLDNSPNTNFSYSFSGDEVIYRASAY